MHLMPFNRGIRKFQASLAGGLEVQKHLDSHLQSKWYLQQLNFNHDEGPQCFSCSTPPPGLAASWFRSHHFLQSSGWGGLPWGSSYCRFKVTAAPSYRGQQRAEEKLLLKLFLIEHRDLYHHWFICLCLSLTHTLKLLPAPTGGTFTADIQLALLRLWGLLCVQVGGAY